MLQITENMGVREAGEIYAMSGYSLSAWPRPWGKKIQKTGITDWWTYSFPYNQLDNNFNIGVNHYLSNTCCVDIDHLQPSIKAFDYLGIDLHKLAQSSMCWRGRPNTYKILFARPKSNFNFAILGFDKKVIFELRGGLQVKRKSYEVLEQISYMDVLPPSVHNITKQSYKFVTKFYSRNDLPELPDKLLEVWQNWEEYRKILYSVLKG